MLHNFSTLVDTSDILRIVLWILYELILVKKAVINSESQACDWTDLRPIIAFMPANDKVSAAVFLKELLVTSLVAFRTFKSTAVSGLDWPNIVLERILGALTTVLDAIESVLNDGVQGPALLAPLTIHVYLGRTP